MAEATQFVFTHKEIITLMVKEKGIHEGRWMLLVNYGMSPGNFGPSPNEISPGMIVAITGLGIQKEPPGQPPASPALVVDAAEVNPAPTQQPSSQSQVAAPESSSPPEPSRRSRPTRHRS